MSTIQDVAARAGVSVSTVSNVLNGREGRMRPETLNRVRLAISDLGFRPNQSARRLKTGHVPMIGLMVPSIANPYFGVLARWVEAAAQEQGYGLLLCNTYREPEREREYAEAFMSQGVKGVILGSALAAHEHLLPLVDDGLAAVSLDRAQVSDGLVRDFVSVDNRLAGSMAVDYLIGLGHRHIAFVSAPAKSMNRIARVEGAKAACERAGATLDVHIGAVDADYTESEMAELGRQAAHDILSSDSPATACVGVNDMIAIGLLAGFRQCAQRIPIDVSVMGIDGIYLGNYVSPTLTTVGQPMEAMARVAVDHVLKRMKNPELPMQESIFEPQLIVRASTGPIAGSAPDHSSAPACSRV
ncbi:MAG: LacI family DNA-binding transcriptional regulator [Zoogloeaceae bacterium]|nr:LacI family DNA-binding transcriptional regulator [Rhodocyclaceae bacterium]MCP5233195.1 LacI family DNA-binding transcriptional regulator [Zoogloeaceae bacterium]MCP5239368.1 LacI family DNA-binding transcriptional regulator [Zoogloeaceae bacterium]MCP5254864.1 LacI family DNA-binding transcriptional regulator [Zoogloeaceae bacterium]MCP5295573.1 LacI family DNA-binding transcriptional regulator [Zoogloeaceae bacterium]